MNLKTSKFYISKSGAITEEPENDAKDTGSVYIWKSGDRIQRIGATWLHPAARAEKHLSTGVSGDFQVLTIKIEDGLDRSRIRDLLACVLREKNCLTDEFVIGKNQSCESDTVKASDREKNFVSSIVESLFPTWRPSTLQTSRLTLRAIRESDAVDVFSYSSKENVTKFVFFDRHRSIEDSHFFIEKIAFPHYERHEPEPYAICLKGAERLIGTCGSFKVRDGVMEMGYVIDDLYWGKGYVAEAGKALVDHVFKTYDVNTIVCRANNKNLASKKVMEKIGFQFDGLLRSSVKIRGEFWDMHMTSILRSEWV